MTPGTDVLLADRNEMPGDEPARRLKLIFVLQVAFGMLAMTICLPSMQDWTVLFDASARAVQWTLGGYVAAFGVGQIVCGAVSDRVGRKPVLLCGLAVVVLGSALAAAASELWLLTLARAAQGFGCAAGAVGGRAAVQDLFTGRARTRMMAAIGMTMGVCPPSGILLGGQLHAHVGWRAGFVLVAVLALALLLATWLGLPRRQAVVAGAPFGLRAMWRGYVQLLRLPVFSWHVALLAMTTAAYYSFLGGGPLTFLQLGVSVEHLGLYMMYPSAGFIVGNIMTQRWLRRGVDERALMRCGQSMAVLAPAIILLLTSLGVNSPLALALPMLLLGVGHGLLIPPTLTVTVGVIPLLAGSAAALAGLLQQLAGAMGSVVVGWLPPTSGVLGLALTMLCWAVVGAAAYVISSQHVAR